MPITIVTTAGAVDANSYSEIAEIDAYAEGTGWASAWAAKTDDEKKNLAVRAARALDSIPFAGYPTNEDQALQFPRRESYQPSGILWATDAIPAPVKRAHMHTAAWLSSFAATAADPFGPAKLANVKRKKLIDVVGETEYFASPDSEGGVFLEDIIVPMLEPWGLTGAGGTVRLVR